MRRARSENRVEIRFVDWISGIVSLDHSGGGQQGPPDPGRRSAQTTFPWGQPTEYYGSDLQTASTLDLQPRNRWWPENDQVEVTQSNSNQLISIVLGWIDKCFLMDKIFVYIMVLGRNISIDIEFTTYAITENV